MTDDGIREALRLDFEQTPCGAPKLPSTQRTVETWRRLNCSTDWPHRSRPSHPTFLMLMAPFGTTTWTPSSTAKCSGRSGSARGPKQPRTLLRRASPTEQWERKVRERRVATKRWAARGLDPGPSASARGDEPVHCGRCRQGPRISAFMLPISNFGNRYLIPVPSGTFGLSPQRSEKPSSRKHRRIRSTC